MRSTFWPPGVLNRSLFYVMTLLSIGCGALVFDGALGSVHNEPAAVLDSGEMISAAVVNSEVPARGADGVGYTPSTDPGRTPGGAQIKMNMGGETTSPSRGGQTGVAWHALSPY